MITCRLKAVLEERGIKQDWLAKRARIYPGSLSQLVNGKRVPTLEVAFRIAHALGMRIEDIWQWEDDHGETHQE